MQTSEEDIYAIGDCAQVNGEIFAYIEPIRRQTETVAVHLAGEEKPFIPKSPLVRVKTPSYPVTICPPSADEHSAIIEAAVDQGRLNYMQGNRIVGFVLSGTLVNKGANLYRELIG
jgi:rubredoxin-NAD+ reductase